MYKNLVTNRSDGKMTEMALRELTNGETVLVSGGYTPGPLPHPSPFPPILFGDFWCRVAAGVAGVSCGYSS
jgi:hypothetical protein